MGRKKITIEEELKFFSRQTVPDSTEIGTYEVCAFYDIEKNIVKFQGNNKVTKFHLLKGKCYSIKYSKILIDKNKFRGFHPIKITLCNKN